MKSRIAATAIVISLIVGLVGFIPPQIAQATPPASPTDATVVPHYFGPYPNYANSPQAGADAIVGITGDGTGATATATVDPTTGVVTGVTVTSPGSGYTTAGVVFTGAGSGATADAVINAGGVVTGVTVDPPGLGYVGYTAPAVAFTGGGASVQAVGIATGGVFDVAITTGGTGYTAPIIDFDLPDSPNGVQAMGTVQIDGSGVVTGVTITSPGSGYWTAPGATIYDVNRFQPGPGTGATVSSTLQVSAVELSGFGTGYTSAPAVGFSDLTGIGSGAVATASTDIGAITAINVTAGGTGYVTPGIKKFVDTLPGLGPTAANNLGQYIPVAVPDTTTYPGTDYYEIAVVQYRERLSSSLPVAGTLLRGYVQLSTTVVPGALVPLTNATLDPAGTPTPILLPNGSPALGVDGPHYLGPIISATKDRPVRILFRDLLPTGVAGDLFLPVDTTIMGSGMGPQNPQADVPPTDGGTVMDAVRNPGCNEGFMTGMPDMCYTQNRATLHLHGGITPWISDGTPHQWITPAGETTSYPKGVSVQNVPDMPDPGPGAQTFFYTNQQSARLMFYHDHSFGITRLNVYAGEAAGYLVTDKTEKALVAAGTIPGAANTIPLVIEDKTFVPSTAALAQEDPTWNATRWGGEGNLWLPHVYMPAQNPGSPTGGSAFGRWMYGPWFWPPATGTQYGPIANPYFDPLCDPNVILPDGSNQFCEPQQIPGTPNLSVGMEAFNDTPVVNGTAYPTVTLAPSSYRLRILNAANDRFWNLQWYVADPTTGTLSEVALKPAEVAAAQTDPNVYPTPDTTLSPAGPDWVQIGTEGGFLPAPTTVSGHQPTTWITDATRFDWGNVKDHSLLLAPAERADTVVDFSQFAGKTLILYNDAPAAFPARVPGYDYYTGDPDLSPTGAPSTLPGYGPNTRTIMQVKIAAAPVAPAFNRTVLNNAFKHHANGSGVFESSQDPIIVGQAAYNSAYGTNFASAGWCSAPNNPSAKCDGFARIQEQGGMNFKFDTLTGHQLSIPIQPKGIHDEMNSSTFDPFGRMQANMGVEAPGATPLLQNIILYPYVNPTTEVLDGISNGVNGSGDFSVTPISSAADGTQIWKITHNGVDTHPIHFHLYDVQVINRVTWDNIIMPPEPSELGWKDTVRISPLQDTIVAVRPITPKLPFGVLDSHRLLNPAMPEGSTSGFNNTDVNGNPLVTSISNVMTDFFWEYVYHCHILSHEEMDMMRPVTVAVPHVLPATPDPVTGVGNGGIDLSWTDGTPITYTDPLNFTNWGSPAGEVGYHIQRAPVASDGITIGTYALINTIPANTTAFHDPVAPGTYSYIVAAFNESGESQSTPFQVSWSTSTLTVTVAGTGTGTVTSASTPGGTPTDINCTNLNTPCVATYPSTTTVTLTATPDVSSTFAGWSGDCTGTGSCVVTMDLVRAVTATFTLKTFDLTVTKAGPVTGTAGTGSVTSDVVPGIDCGVTCVATFNYGTVVTLTATPDVSSTFDGWSGDCTGTGSCVVTIDQARAVTATFTLKTFDLTVTKAGPVTGTAGTGSVTSDVVPGIDCGVTCVATFNYGTVVTLTATPDITSNFTGWSGAGCTGTGTCVVSMTAARAATATFALKTFDLSVTLAGTGAGNVTSDLVPGIDCGLTCTATFDYGTSVTLTATPSGNSTFMGWTGSGCAAAGTGPCVVPMTAARAVTATFNLKQSLTVTKAGPGVGSVTSVPTGIDCGATCAFNFNYGISVTLTATPRADSTFMGWTGAGCTGIGTCVVSLTAARAVTATFNLKQSLTVTKAGNGVGNVASVPLGVDCGATCSFNFDYGTLVTLTETPGINSTFRGWSGAGCTGTGTTCVVPMTAARAVTATFALSYLPDGMIATNAGAFVGNNIYNTDGTSQTRTATIQRGNTVTYRWRIQNDGVLSDLVSLKGSASAPGFRVRYFAGGTNITTAVVAGTYQRTIAPGATVTNITVQIRVNATATIGAVQSALLTATSTHFASASDTVLVRITAR